MTNAHNQRLAQHHLYQALASGMGLFVLALLSNYLSRPHSATTLFWCANAWLAANLSLARIKHWPLYLLTGAVAIVLANLITGHTGRVSLLLVPGDIVESMVGATLLRHFKLTYRFDRHTGAMMAMLVSGAFVAPLIGSLIGAAMLGFAATGDGTWPDIVLRLLTSSGTGAIVTLPLSILLLRADRSPWARAATRVEQIAFMAALFGGEVVCLHYISYPFVFLAALLALATEALSLRALLAAAWGYCAVFVVMLGRGSFVQIHPVTDALGVFQLMTSLMMATVPSLLLAVSRNARRLENWVLQQAQSRLDAVFEHMEEGLLIQAQDGHILLCNAMASTMLGIPQGAVTMTQAWPLLAEDGTALPAGDHSAYQALFSSTPKHGRLIGVRAPDGDVRWLSTNVLPIKEEETQAPLFLCTFIDVTEQRKTHMALSSLQARFGGLVDNAPDAILTIDASQRLVGANKAAAELFGYSVEEMLQETLSVLLPESIREPHTQLVKAFALEQSSGRRMGAGREVWGRRKDGSTFPMEVALAKVSLPDGIYYMAIGRDVSQRQSFENATRELTQALAQSPAGFVIANLDGRIEYVNQAYQELIGRDEAALLHDNFAELHQACTPQERISDMWSALKAGQAWRGEMGVPAPTSGERTFFYVISPIRNANGGITKYVGVAEDITERRRIGKELDQYREGLETMVAERTQALVTAKMAAEEAVRAKSGFLANMSHEIRTPLNAVIGFASFLSGEVTTASQREYIDRIDSAAQHLLGVIDDILDFSKLEAGKLERKDEAVDVASLLNYVADLARSRLADRPVDVRISIASTVPPHIQADRLRLGQILGNFASNAAKFTESGVIDIEAALSDDSGSNQQIKLSVRDTGIGLTPEQQSRLFLPFSQADASITRRYGGTGLGLALSRNLAALLGGKVGVSSVTGKGSCFWVQIPLCIPEGAEHETPATMETKAIRLCGHLLVAEDNPANRVLIDLQLTKLGVSHDTVTNGQAAIDACQTARFNAILMDMQMPIMDGLTATRLIRQQMEIPQVPIIAMTANAMVEDRAACFEAGMNDFIVKPVLFDTLARCLSKYLPTADTLDTGSADVMAHKPMVERATNLGLPAELGAYGTRLKTFVGADFALALKQANGSAALLEQLLAIFVRYHAALPYELDYWLQQGDVSAAIRTVHTLKGTARTLAAQSLTDQAEKIEQQLQSGQQVDTQPLHALCDAAVQHIQGEQAHLANPAAIGTLQRMLAQHDKQIGRWLTQQAENLGSPTQAGLDRVIRLAEEGCYDAATAVLCSMTQSYLDHASTMAE